MTEQLAMNEAQAPLPTIQCTMCIREIPLDDQLDSSHSPWVLCPHCGYRQPTSKLPRLRDLAIFGGTIGVVYLATIVAVLLVR